MTHNNPNRHPRHKDNNSLERLAWNIDLLRVEIVELKDMVQGKGIIRDGKALIIPKKLTFWQRFFGGKL